MKIRVTWNAVERLLKLGFGLVTAAASTALAIVAVLALQEARREWLVVPAPENLRGELINGKVRLSWEPPETHADMVREIVVLQGSNQGEEQWGVMKPIKELPPDARFYSAPACEDRSGAAPLICIYRVRVIASNARKGELSRRVICTSEKCGYVPDEESPAVWQPYR